MSRARRDGAAPVPAVATAIATAPTACAAEDTTRKDATMPETRMHAVTDQPLHSLIAARWSPQDFAARPLAETVFAGAWGRPAPLGE